MIQRNSYWETSNVELDVAGRWVDTAGHLTVGFDQQLLDPPGYDRAGDVYKLIVTEMPGPCFMVLLHKISEPFTEDNVVAPGCCSQVQDNFHMQA